MSYAVDIRSSSEQRRTPGAIVLSVFITILVVIGAIGMLINLGITGLFLNKVPTGDRAMGLIVPIFTTGIATIAMILATWLCAARGGFAWISGTTMVPTLVATAVTFGVCLAAMGALLAWMEMQNDWGRAVPVLGLVCSGLVPLALGGMLLVCVWTEPATLAQISALKIAGAALAAGALVGYSLGAIGLKEWATQAASNNRAAIAEIQARDAKWERKRTMPRADLIREEFAEMSAEAPLWVFVARLPEQSDDECRELIITRALMVPDFDAQLERTITDSCHLYRQGCADLIRWASVAQRKAAWAGPLASSIRVCAAEMELRPAWMTETSQLNPNPAAHVETLVKAAESLGNPAETTAALNELRSALKSLTASDAREQAERELDRWHKSLASTMK